jgi:hypothetical protein
MSARKVLAAVISLSLLVVAGTQTVAARVGGVGAYRSGAVRRMDAGQRRAAQRRTKRKMSKRTTEGEVRHGVWGGPHVRLTVREGGAALEFDCARGEISEPLKTNTEGRFDLQGIFTRQGPGPIRVGLTPPSRPARYVGRVEGRTMTFSIKLTDMNRETETFTLTRGSEGRLRKCR